MDSVLLSDDAPALRAELMRSLGGDGADAPRVVITSGGTGLSPRDITPETVEEACRALGGREVPGFGERLRADGARHTPRAWLSRSTAFLVRRTLVLCLPGSPKAVIEGLEAVGGLIPHVLHVAQGGGHAP